MNYSQEDYLMLSGIQHFSFCRRQWALIHIEQQWAENFRTTSGELFHKNAHNENKIEKRGNIIITRGLRISSAQLGISGQCDVVEFHKDLDGISLHKYDGKWKPVPIEYKRGKPKTGLEDQLQLCAQTICLEEMFLTNIEKGYLFYGENKRRTEVIFNDDLRNKVFEICREMHQLFKKGYTPKVKAEKRCKSCSLCEICMPVLLKSNSVEQYISGNMEDD